MTKKNIIAKFFLFQSFTLIAFLSFSQNKNSNEKFEITVDKGVNIIPYMKMPVQSLPQPSSATGNRGIVTSFLISKGVQGIQSLIENRKKKYTANYSFAIKDESFYDNISTLGPFDPTGINFKGFKVARVLKNSDGSTDTAFIAKFVIDTSQDKIKELMNNSVFTLKLDSFILKSARVKMPHSSKKLNFDFEINFLASFIGDNGQINSDVCLGKFIYTVRDAPVDANEIGYKEFYENLPKNKPNCTGQAFLVPRSAGYFKNSETGTIEKCYGIGLYSIKAAVKESSKNNFADKLIVYTSSDIITLGNAGLVKKYGSAPAAPPKPQSKP
jgi:hypothetical protein